MISGARYLKNRLYIDSGASLHILFNKVLMGELHNTDKTLKIQAGGKPFHIKQIGSLHQALRHLPLPVTAYHYSETAIANLLLFTKLVDEYYIICNTRIDDAIYVESKDGSKYLRFQYLSQYVIHLSSNPSDDRFHPLQKLISHWILLLDNRV